MTDAQQAAAEMQTVQRRLQAMDQNLSRLEASLQDLHTAISTLENLGGGGDTAAHFPIGGGVHVPATVDASADVLVDVGKGYSSKMPVKDALPRLRDRLRDVESAFRSTREDAQKAADRLQELQAQAMDSSS